MDGESTALLTDHYELTMLEAALAGGTAQRRSVFELFPRRLPEGRRYGVVAGVGRALDAVEAFRFDEPTLAFLADGRIVDDPTLEWLAGYRFGGHIWGYAEGDLNLAMEYMKKAGYSSGKYDGGETFTGVSDHGAVGAFQ